jgi:hypothetical protein
VILINDAWLSLMVFKLHELNDYPSVLASLAIVGSFTGLIGAGLAAISRASSGAASIQRDGSRSDLCHGCWAGSFWVFGSAATGRRSPRR